MPTEALIALELANASILTLLLWRQHRIVRLLRKIADANEALEAIRKHAAELARLEQRRHITP